MRQGIGTAIVMAASMALGVSGVAASAAPSPSEKSATRPDKLEKERSERQKRRRLLALHGVSENTQRSKNPPTKRKLKRNMNHVSKRTKRKHRAKRKGK